MELMEYFLPVTEFLGNMVQRYGLYGIALAMFAESAGVPFASSVVIATSGGMIYSGKVNFLSVLAASTAGITLGSIFSYCLGFLSSSMGKAIRSSWLKQRCSNNQLPNTPAGKSKALAFWERYGSFSVFMGQLFGVTRTFISFPAGAMKMNLFLFVIYTALGGALFSLAAISSSILLTGALGLFIYYIRLLLSLPSWSWPLVMAALFAFAVFYRHNGWKLSSTRPFVGIKRFTKKIKKSFLVKIRAK